jgi:tetratricopeptide (TPR) repeat protein
MNFPTDARTSPSEASSEDTKARTDLIETAAHERRDDRTAPAPVAPIGGWTTDPDGPDRTATAHEATRDLPCGETVRYFGDYEIQKTLGRGGMGVVYQARQISLNRLVALKMIKVGVLAGDAELKRFQNEAEAVALLDHAGIVPVYEVGEHNGQRYFSMKLVEGGNLAEGLATFKNNAKAAATLLAETAEAVHHAHMRGILHRDLKPANILIDALGHSHVTDFGLAKRVEGDIEMTQSGAILGTPAYMSPEQAHGRRGAITTATDVYGLGAILYALLTGEPPFGGDSVIETLDAVRTRPPEPPRKRNAATPRDLETICLKCLEKDPRRRYSSAQSLADDLKNWLDCRPITARRSGAAERAWLWCKRKPVVAALAAAVLLAVILGAAAVIAVQTEANRVLETKNLDLRASNARLDAERERAEARETQAIAAVKRFGDAVSKNAALKNNPTLEPLRKELLKEPLAFFSDLRSQLQLDRDTRPESLDRLAEASFELGKLTTTIGDKQDALIALRESLAIWQKLADAKPNVTMLQRNLANSHEQIGRVLSATGQTAEAITAHERALAIRQKLADSSPNVTEFQSDLAVSHSLIGVVRQDTGKLAEALKSHQSALAIRQKLADSSPTVTKYQSELALCQHNIACVLDATGNKSEAMKTFQAALPIHQKLAAANPGDPQYQMILAEEHHAIAGVLRITGKPAEALSAYNAALEIRQKLAELNPAVTEIQSKLALTHRMIGYVLSATGKPGEALEAYDRALAIEQKLVDSNPTVTDFQRNLTGSHLLIGDLFFRVTGKPAEALKAYERALAICQKLADSSPSVTDYQSLLAGIHNNTGLVLQATGKLVEALKTFQSALAIQQKLADANPTVNQFQSQLASTHNNVGIVLQRIGNLAEALKAYQRALRIHQKLADSNPTVTQYQIHLAHNHNNIGLLLERTGKPAEALKALERALAIKQKLAASSPTVTDLQSFLAQGHYNISVLLSATGQPAESILASERAISIFQKLADANPTVTEFQDGLARGHDQAGDVLRMTGKSAEARKAYQAALAIRQKLARQPKSADFASQLASDLYNLANIDTDAKRFEEARLRYREAIEWDRKALAVDPANPVYRQSLGQHLRALIVAARGLGDSDGVAELERELARLAVSDPSAAALDKRLAAIKAGEQPPKDEAERLALAQQAYDRSLYATAARLWGEALANNPKLADDRQAAHRYNAACAAALAGCGMGRDDPPSDRASMVKLRFQALDWLKAELAVWSKFLESGPPQARPVVASSLTHWQEDSDLASIRDEKQLAKLTDEERAAFNQLWNDVARLLAKAHGRK